MRLTRNEQSVSLRRPLRCSLDKGNNSTKGENAEETTINSPDSYDCAQIPMCMGDGDEWEEGSESDWNEDANEEEEEEEEEDAVREFFETTAQETVTETLTDSGKHLGRGSKLSRLKELTRRATHRTPKPKIHRDGIYIVCESIEFSDPKQADRKFYSLLKGLKTKFELQEFIVMQHWGIRIGDYTYQLYKTENNTIALSLQKMENATLEIPIWRTALAHEERLGMAIGVIRQMSNRTSDEEVEVYVKVPKAQNSRTQATEKEEEAQEQVETQQEEARPILMDPQERQLYQVSKSFHSLTLPMLFKGKYNLLSNSCINFCFRFFLGQILNLSFKSLRRIRPVVVMKNAHWVAKQWIKKGREMKIAQIVEKLMKLAGSAFLLSTTKKVKQLSTRAVKQTAKDAKELVERGQDEIHPIVDIILLFFGIDVSEKTEAKR